MGRVKRIWYLQPMRAAKVQAKARSLDPLNGWACAVKVCHDGMLKDANSLDGAQINQVVLYQSINLLSAFKNYFELASFNSVRKVPVSVVSFKKEYSS